MSKTSISILLFFLFFFLSKEIKATPTDSIPKIQVAILLDVSGSMKGLINQAQTQIWKIASYLSQLEKENVQPLLEIAVITYGNMAYEENDHVHIESFFEKEIDIVAEILSLIGTGGGNEYCGKAIQVALDSLKWSNNPADLKMIIIAGNENFDQGEVSFEAMADSLVQKNILLNTIYCGTKEAGIEDLWDDASFRGKGEFAVIDHEMKLENLETPYDTKIINMYQLYRTTMLFYGKEGLKKTIRLQEYDDQNADNRNIFFRDRIIFKILHERKDKLVDLIQLMEESPRDFKNIKKEDLPEELRSKSIMAQQQFLMKKMQQREVVKDGIRLYQEKIDEFVATKIDKEKIALRLDVVLEEILKKQATAKGFAFIEKK